MILGSVASAEVPVHKIDISGNYRLPGKTDVRPLVVAVSGKPLEVRWHADEEPSLKVVRITDTRQIPLADVSATRVDDKWSWAWQPPDTNGVVNYELRQAGLADPIIRIEVRNAAWFDKGMMFLKSAKWQVTGLEPDERAALTGLGLRVVAERGKAPGSGLVTMVPGSGANGSRREVILIDHEDSKVVWNPGTVSGDWRISVPRWWFSKESLMTDEGKIRLLDLFFDSPTIP